MSEKKHKLTRLNERLPESYTVIKVALHQALQNSTAKIPNDKLLDMLELARSLKNITIETNEIEVSNIDDVKDWCLNSNLLPLVRAELLEYFS